MRRELLHDLYLLLSSTVQYGHMKAREMVRACSTRASNVKYVQNFARGSEVQRPSGNTVAGRFC
jgi:hypothetical protein